MKKSIKGAVAAGGAAVILMGGAGSLAYWSSTDDVLGGDIDTGQLALNAVDCDTAKWIVTNAIEGVTAAAAVEFDLANDAIVPGDVLTKTCDVVINAVGENLRADLDFSSTSVTGSSLPVDDYTVTPTFLDSVSGLGVSAITDANEGDTIIANIVVTFPLDALNVSADNLSQDKLLDLQNYTVTATQATS